MLFWLFLFGKASLTEARFNWRYGKSVAKWRREWSELKAIVIDQPGGPEQLKLKDVPTPQTKPGWSLIKIKSFDEFSNQVQLFVPKDFGGSSPA